MTQFCHLCRIDLQHVSVTRGGQELLHDVSMHIHCGQLTALIGQNGAGKTTLIRALLKQLPYSGSIRHINEHDREIQRLQTGYVPQNMEFDREMPLTVQDLMATAFTHRPVWTGVSRKVREQVLDALREVNAADIVDHPLGRCSGGEIQRVLLALSMHPAPDLLVMDEPVSGIDQNGLQLFLDTVSSLRMKHHLAILLVSHDLRLVRDYADHVVLLDKTVLCQGQPDYVFESPEFHRAFGSGEAE